MLFVFNLGSINAQGWGKAEPSPSKVELLWIGSFPECEAEGLQGVKSLTTVGTEKSDAQCTQKSIVTTSFSLIANKVNGEKDIIGLAGLADSRYPDGGQT